MKTFDRIPIISYVLILNILIGYFCNNAPVSLRFLCWLLKPGPICYWMIVLPGSFILPYAVGDGLFRLGCFIQDKAPPPVRHVLKQIAHKMFNIISVGCVVFLGFLSYAICATNIINVNLEVRAYEAMASYKATSPNYGLFFPPKINMFRVLDGQEVVVLQNAGLDKTWDTFDDIIRLKFKNKPVNQKSLRPDSNPVEQNDYENEQRMFIIHEKQTTE